MLYDVIVVGAGPGGSSAANFLARQGVKLLLLDKSDFPRDKVCGDGMTPQAVYWLDRLGCAAEVLAHTKGCIKSADIIINKERVLTGGYPGDTIYPDFAILLDRRRFDHILLNHAVGHGAEFQGGTTVRDIVREEGHVRVLARRGGQDVEYRGRIVIGADGVSSAVSRAIGNTLKEGVMAVSVRAYYRGARCDGAQMKVYFDRDYFPGYGWLFVDDEGFANIGLGCLNDKRFPMADNLGASFRRFLAVDLADILAGAVQCGPVSGGSSGFFRPKAIVAERVMLIGDAANQADPLNGGGIHKAMESAWCAAEACRLALAEGDFSLAAMKRYETLWSRQWEADWRTAEIFMSIAKNPNLRDFSLFMLRQMGRLTMADPKFRDFAAGIFSGVVSQSAWLVPQALYRALPKDPDAWIGLLKINGREKNGGIAAGTMHLAYGVVANAFSAATGMMRAPIANLDWGVETAAKAAWLAERRFGSAGAMR
ncbi:MAG TPA: geranylgeranyl reductase family protein [Rhizomicrobium sp.]|jgi:geranylgeranyl reductase family protein|nr:geranylgeranyl reductase family protein [Rhizomicrobium sp.]